MRFEIVDSQTGNVVAHRTGRLAAEKVVDRMNAQHGSYRYVTVALIERVNSEG